MDDVRRSLKAKTEIERQNNKRRQRSLKSEDLGTCSVLSIPFVFLLWNIVNSSSK